MEDKPYKVKLGDGEIEVFGYNEQREQYLAENPGISPKAVGIIAVALFRKNGFMDYVSVAYDIDDVAEECKFTQTYIGEWADWLAGFALEQDRHDALIKRQIKLGEFCVKYGWQPTVVVENEPSEQEIEMYVQAQIKDLNQSRGVPRDFMRKDEDDGA